MQLQLSSGNALVRNMPQSVWKILCIEKYFSEKYSLSGKDKYVIDFCLEKIQKYMYLKNISCPGEFLASGFYFRSYYLWKFLVTQKSILFPPLPDKQFRCHCEVTVLLVSFPFLSYLLRNKQSQMSLSVNCFNFYQIYFERAATAWLTSTLQTCNNVLKS